MDIGRKTGACWPAVAGRGINFGGRTAISHPVRSQVRRAMCRMTCQAPIGELGGGPFGVPWSLNKNGVGKAYSPGKNVGLASSHLIAMHRAISNRKRVA